MLTYVFTGYKILSVPLDRAAELLELCRRCGYPYDSFTTREAEKYVTLRVKTATADKLMAACAACGLPVTVIKAGGLPLWGKWLWRRPGLWVGLLAVIALLFISSRFVWDVRVTGNETVTEHRVEETLRACGFGVGSYLGSFKADRIENQALMADRSLAWISINVKGTVAHVQIREAAHPPEASDQTPANLIAATGGQIVRVELTRGNVIVSPGQWVDEGDLLVSGLYDSDQVGFRYTHALGKVYARTVEEITVSIPLTYEKKVYSEEDGVVLCERSLIFFENYIKFSKKTGNVGGSCDTIRRVSIPFSFSGVDFPIALVTEWSLPYTTVEEKRTYAEALELAYLVLAQRIGSIPGGAEILNKSITTTLGEDTLLLTCTLTCVRDIAEERTFEILP